MVISLLSFVFVVEESKRLLDCERTRSCLPDHRDGDGAGLVADNDVARSSPSSRVIGRPQGWRVARPRRRAAAGNAAGSSALGPSLKTRVLAQDSRSPRNLTCVLVRRFH